MGAIWNHREIIWKTPVTWLNPLTQWLRRYLKPRSTTILKSLGFKDHCYDDLFWQDLIDTYLVEGYEYTAENLGNDIERAIIRAYHGGRVQDAETYHRKGILRNDPSAMAEEARRIVREEPKLGWSNERLEEELSKWEPKDRDKGKLHVAVDDRFIINQASHYLIYGSEWIMAFFGFGGHDVLRRRGVPTMVEIDLPLEWIRYSVRVQLAKALLCEWTRIKVNRPDFVPELDFTFTLHFDVPPEWIVGHYHPLAIPDGHHMGIIRKTNDPLCPYCRAASSEIITNF